MSKDSKPEVRQTAVKNLVDRSDITIGAITQTVNRHQPDFFEPNLEQQFQDENFVEPDDNFVSILSKIIQTQNLLVLGGSDNLDKATLARYLAWHLSKSSDGGKRFVKEWQRGSEPQTIEVELQKSDKPSIYIFTQLSPQNVGYNLIGIKKAATLGQHYVVITTDIPKASWKLTPESDNFWKDLYVDREIIYDSYSLVKVLFQTLMEVEKPLPPVLQNEKFDPNQLIVSNFTFRKVAEQLQTPDKIFSFVQSLQTELKGKKLNEILIENLINKVKNPQETLEQWYYQILDPRSQRMALGLNFLDGLYDDQFFAALEEIIGNAWQKREPSLGALDYCDLDNLLNFFNRYPIGIDEQKVESRFPNQRLMLFQVAWKSHRRQILAALPTIEKLVKNSVADREFHESLYGSSKLREQIRNVLGSALSDIGSISPNAVQDILLNLAADEEIEVQAVAANVIAQWRNPIYSRDEELFKLLHEWQNNARVLSQVKSVLNNQDEAPEPQDYIRATIALTVGEAAIYDPPNKLHPKLYELVKQLSEDSNYLVRDRFCSYTLPKIVPQHLVKLLSLLREMTKHLDLIRAISRSLALAYQYHPQIVLETLELWENISNSNQTQNNAEPPPEHLLTTVALTYGEIDYDEGSTFTANQAASHLQNLLKDGKPSRVTEKKPKIEKKKIEKKLGLSRFFLKKPGFSGFFLKKPSSSGLTFRNTYQSVRLAVLTAMCIQLLKNKEFEAHLHEITNQITRYERNYLVERLTEIYLIQRQTLNNSDRVTLITERRVVWTDVWPGPKIKEEKNRYYPIWLDSSQRPKTAIEATLLRWLKDDSNPMAQEIATQAFIGFALALDQKEAEHLEELKQERPVSVTKKPVGTIITKRPFHGVYLDWLVPWFLTRKINRLSIRHLLPEALKHHNRRKEVMDFVLLQWRNTQDTKLQKISDLLKSGFWWAKNLKIFGGVAVLLIFLVGFAALTMREKSTVSQQTIIPQPKAMIDSGVSVAEKADILDTDSANFDGGKLTIQFTENATANDRLGIHLSGTPSEIEVKGKHNEKQEIVYEVFHRDRVIGYFQDDYTGDLEIVLTANATKAETKALIRTFAYQNISNTPQLGERKIELQLTDGDGGISNAFSRTINVVTKNEVPVINVPDDVKTQTIRETQKLFISGISVSDAENQELTVTLQVKKGRLTVKRNVSKGLNSKNINSNGTERVELKGTLLKINTTLANSSAITYQSHLGFSGEDFLQIAVEDSGKKITSDDGLAWPPGAIDSKKTTKAVNITVIPAIIITMPDVQTVDEDINLTISGINIDAPDSKNATVTLEVSNGTLAIKDNVANGVNRGRIQSNKTSKVTLKRSTIAKINTTLKDSTAIIYKGAKNSMAPDNLKITVTDNGKRMAEKSIQILVNPINDAPEITEEQIISKPPIAEPKVASQVRVVPQVRVAKKRVAPQVRVAKKRVAKKRVAKKRVAKKRVTPKVRVAKKRVTPKVRVAKKRVAKKRVAKKRVAPKARVAKKVTPKVKVQPVPKKKAISPTPKTTLGKRARTRADAQYNRLAKPSPRKWWKLVCQTMKKVYKREIAKTKTTRQQDKRKIRRRVLNGTVNSIYQDERKKRNGWSRNRIRNKISRCF